MRRTIEVSERGKIVWDRWKAAMDLSSVELFNRIVEAAQRKHQHHLYLSLPVPSGCVRKALRGKKLKPNVYN